MKTPIWFWDEKQGHYLWLPAGIWQFKDGDWGYAAIDWNSEVSDFYNEHKSLFKLNLIHQSMDWKIVLRNTRPQDKHWYSKLQARITKVQNRNG